jgi:hypothetical protein
VAHDGTFLPGKEEEEKEKGREIEKDSKPLIHHLKLEIRNLNFI